MEELLEEGRSLRRLDGGLRSALDDGAEQSTYDRQAALYDRVIGTAPYNRLVWGASPDEYTDFARRAVDSGDGPFLDAGCGTLVFTADVYARTARPLVLADMSEGMLRRAARRLGGTDSLVQADILDLPFEAGSFATVGSFGVLHCLPDLDGALASLARQLRPGGEFHASSLVAASARSRRMLALLERAGEVAPARTEDEFAEAVGRHFAVASTSRRGSMAYVTATGRG